VPCPPREEHFAARLVWNRAALELRERWAEVTPGDSGIGGEEGQAEPTTVTTALGISTNDEIHGRRYRRSSGTGEVQPLPDPARGAICDELTQTSTTAVVAAVRPGMMAQANSAVAFLQSSGISS
jgi:hypothetical protein